MHKDWSNSSNQFESESSDDVQPVQSCSGHSTPPSLDLGTWVLQEGSRCCWVVPSEGSSFSAGVPLQTIRPRVVIPSHLGEIVVLQKQNLILKFVLLSSFIDGLHVVRQQFERALEEGRRTATTAEERVSNLRKCRERMTACSDQVVMEHMKMLPVEWKDGSVAEVSFQRFECRTVLHLTTPDGRVVDCKDETNVAVVGDDWHVDVHVRKDRRVIAGWNKGGNRLSRISPSNGCYTKAFGQNDTMHTVHAIRYVRDPDSKTDAIQVCEVMNSDGGGRLEMLSVQFASSGATGRWLVFSSATSCAIVYDKETGKMAYLRAPSAPTVIIETSEGLWMWGLNFDRWSKLFKFDALQSLDYKDPSMFNQPMERVQRRVVGKMLDAEAFREVLCEGIQRPERLRTFRKEGRHPGHYWVVAGYGPVPTSVRAADHIYKELETPSKLTRYQGDFPFWFVRHDTPRSLIAETQSADHFCWTGAIRYPGTWAGAVDLRDGVTAESIKEDPKSDAWRVGMPMQSGASGEFPVTGNTLSMQLFSFVPLELPVKPGRWLWRVYHRGIVLELTLRHESVAAADIAKCTAPARLVDSRKLECYLTQLRSLAPVIPEEGLRAKIAEFSDWLYPPTAYSCSRGAILLDKNVIDKDTEWHVLIGGKEQVIPLAGGLAVDCARGFPEVFVGENMLRLAFRNNRDETW